MLPAMRLFLQIPKLAYDRPAGPIPVRAPSSFAQGHARQSTLPKSQEEGLTKGHNEHTNVSLSMHSKHAAQHPPDEVRQAGSAVDTPKSLTVLAPRCRSMPRDRLRLTCLAPCPSQIHLLTPLKCPCARAYYRVCMELPVCPENVLSAFILARSFTCSYVRHSKYSSVDKRQ